jgi:hypothetical protein
MKSNAYGRIIAGPVGSGKTTACMMELLRRALGQAPGHDGYRYTRFAVVRQTLKQLKDTVLKDCETWLGSHGLGSWKVSDSTYHVLFDDIRSEWVFLPLEDAEDQARLLSMQLTGAWLSECIEMDISILGPVSGRLGRYPSGARGNPSWFGMVADTNMPTEMTPWHNFLENLPPDWMRFFQPSGIALDAENLEWLVQTDQTIKLPPNHPVRIAQGRKYYERFINMYGAESDWVKRYVYAQYGDDPSGQAVFKNTFRSNFHIVDETLLIPGFPLLIGQDFGRNPWSLICQPDHMGRLIVHEEVPGLNVGLEKHVAQSLRPALMRDQYLGFKVAIVGDPSGVAKNSISEESCFDAIKRMGFPAFPAPTNDIEPRLRAVEALLGRQTNGGPTLMINRHGCPHLIRALSGGYRFTKEKTGTLKPVPDKLNGTTINGQIVAFSHVVDDLQYVSLVVHGGMMPYIRSYMAPRRPGNTAGISARGWT